MYITVPIRQYFALSTWVDAVLCAVVANVALDGEADMIGEIFNEADLAIDDNVSPDYDDCAHAQAPRGDTGSWFIYLDDVYLVTGIDIYNSDSKPGELLMLLLLMYWKKIPEWIYILETSVLYEKHFLYTGRLSISSL